MLIIFDPEHPVKFNHNCFTKYFSIDNEWINLMNLNDWKSRHYKLRSRVLEDILAFKCPVLKALSKAILWTVEIHSCKSWYLLTIKRNYFWSKQGHFALQVPYKLWSSSSRMSIKMDDLKTKRHHKLLAQPRQKSYK